MPITVVFAIPGRECRHGRAAMAAAATLAKARDTRVVVLRSRPKIDPRAVYGERKPSAETSLPSDVRVVDAVEGDDKALLAERPDLVLSFGPGQTVRPADIPTAEPGRIRRLWSAFTGFYRERPARIALLVTSLFLCYGGGAAMFYVHSIHFGEGGPAISPYLHWALDSTFGFIGLTPVVAVLLPAVGWLATKMGKAAVWAFPVLVGLAFALVTTPGPIGHDLLVARGTPVAQLVTHLFGDPSMAMPAGATHSLAAKMVHQLVPGLVVYTALSLAAFWLIRRLVRQHA